MAETRWELLEILLERNTSNIALILLNQPLQKDARLFQILWKKAVFKALVDGASNRLYDNLAGDVDEFLPDIVTGDFDSVRPDVLKIYKEKGCIVTPTPDQDETDFTKCLKIVLEMNKTNKLDCVVAFGAFEGRVDHMFGNINTLFTANHLAPSLPIYLMDNLNMACLLQKGSHRLDVKSGLEGDSCGLIPIDGTCNCVTTKGLKWNLNHQALKFGELISTSNTWNGDSVVNVETDNVLLWTMNIKDT